MSKSPSNLGANRAGAVADRGKRRRANRSRARSISRRSRRSTGAPAAEVINGFVMAVPGFAVLVMVPIGTIRTECWQSGTSQGIDGCEKSQSCPPPRPGGSVRSGAITGGGIFPSWSAFARFDGNATARGSSQPTPIFQQQDLRRPPHPGRRKANAGRPAGLADRVTLGGCWLTAPSYPGQRSPSSPPFARDIGLRCGNPQRRPMPRSRGAA
jgi:hypothetical protein